VRSTVRELPSLSCPAHLFRDGCEPRGDAHRGVYKKRASSRRPSCLPVLWVAWSQTSSNTNGGCWGLPVFWSCARAGRLPRNSWRAPMPRFLREIPNTSSLPDGIRPKSYMSILKPNWISLAGRPRIPQSSRGTSCVTIVMSLLLMPRESASLPARALFVLPRSSLDDFHSHYRH